MRLTHIYLFLFLILTINVQAQNKKPIPPRTLQAFNTYIDFINKTNKRSNYLITWEQRLYAYMEVVKGAEQKLKNNPGYKLLENERLGLKNKHMALAGVTRMFGYSQKSIKTAAQQYRYLPKDYQLQVTQDLKAVATALNNKIAVAHKLAAHVKSKTYEADNYATVLKLLEAYPPLYNKISERLQKLKSSLFAALSTYTLPKQNASLQAFATTIEASKPAIEAIQKFLFKDSKHLFDANTETLLKKAAKTNTPQGLGQGYEKVVKASEKFKKTAHTLTSAQGKYLVSPRMMQTFMSDYNTLVKTYNQIAKNGNPPVLQKINYSKVTVYDTLTNHYTPCDCKSSSQAINMNSMQGFAPVNFMLLMDVSLSMKDDLPMLKDALKYLVSIMRPEDKVSVVGFSREAWLILKPTSAAQREKIFEAIDTVSIKTGTDGEKGLRKAYEWVQKNYQSNANNRVVMATDGEFKMGFDTYDLIGEKADKNIVLSIFSFADQIKYYKQLKSMARQGKGNYELVVPGNIAYKIVREAQAKKLPGQKNITQAKAPCNCSQTKVQPPRKKRTNITVKTNAHININSMKGFAHNNLMLLLDVSGSMADKDKLPLLKNSFKYLVNIMRPEDDVSVVVYAGDAAIVLKPTSASNQDKINAVIDKLRSKGKTNVKAGFKLAYKWINKNFKKGGNNRIILATDGEFPLDKYLYKLVEKQAKRGINLSVFSFGSLKEKYDSLIKLVEKGKGNYEHIDENNAKYKLVKEAQSKQIK